MTDERSIRNSPQNSPAWIVEHVWHEPAVLINQTNYRKPCSDAPRMLQHNSHQRNPNRWLLIVIVVEEISCENRREANDDTQIPNKPIPLKR